MVLLGIRMRKGFTLSFSVRMSLEFPHCLGNNVSNPHPLTDTVYFASSLNTKQGTAQHLVISRLRLGQTTFEHVHTFFGGGEKDGKIINPTAYAKSQITPGNCTLLSNGSLVVAFSAVPMSGTGEDWKPCVEVLPNIDDPWTHGPAQPATRGPAGANGTPGIQGPQGKPGPAGKDGAAAVGGLTLQQVDDRVWAKAADAIYADLAKPGSGILGRIMAAVVTELRTRKLIP